MKESDIEELAIHDGPEPCVGARKGAGEALAGAVQAGRLSREITQSGVPTLSAYAEGNIPVGAMRGGGGPCAVVEPRHVRNPYAREPGDPTTARLQMEGRAATERPRP